MCRSKMLFCFPNVWILALRKLKIKLQYFEFLMKKVILGKMTIIHNRKNYGKCLLKFKGNRCKICIQRVAHKA